MAFDKVKTLRAAEKNLEQGKIPAAIREYTLVVQNEPEDFATLNTLGDLYVRVGDQPAAISCFQRIAGHYREQDFGLKAIAIYKKIDRLQPHDTEIATHLADLYAQQDLVVEARAHYLAVAEAHNRSGATHDALEVLRKIADLEPQNTEIRTRLAEGYLKEEMTAEAATSFAEAGQRLLARGASDNALEVFGKALRIRPGDRASLKGLLAAHTARGTADEAAEVIKRASTNNPDDIELLSLLARAHVEADDPAQAERITASLVAKESSAYLRYVDVARLYLSNDKVEDAVRVVALIAEQMLAEREENQLLDLVNELLTCDSDNVQALRLLVRAHWWQRDMEKLKAALERLAESAETAGLEKDERYALTQLTRLIPDQAHHIERLSQLGGAEEEAEIEALPDFEPVTQHADEAAPVGDQFGFDSQTLSTPAGEAEFEWNPVGDIADTRAESDSHSAGERGFTFETVVAEELASDEEHVIADADSDARNAAIRAQELESVDFYIAQGYADIAIDTLDLLERQFGPHADIDVRRHQLQTATENGKAPTVDPKIVLDGGNATPSQRVPELPSPSIVAVSDLKPTNPQPPPPPGIHPSLAEVFEEYRASAEKEADTTGNGDYETHFNLGLAYKEMDLFEEALEEFQIAVATVAAGDGTARYLQCCNLLGHCFMRKGVPQLAMKWFNKGLNAPGASEDERQALRYELGDVYEQIGDLDRAIEIFTEVYGINVSYRGVNERLRRLQSQTALRDDSAVMNQQALRPS